MNEWPAGHYCFAESGVSSVWGPLTNSASDEDLVLFLYDLSLLFLLSYSVLRGYLSQVPVNGNSSVDKYLNVECLEQHPAMWGLEAVLGQSGDPIS